jgi:glycosyltransferase involved in cell wall biosynthesis
MKLCALIPVYNNSGTIVDVIERTRTVLEPDILVVSDGCTDGSDDLAKKTGVNLVGYEDNKGKGYAIRYGLKEALKKGFTHALVLDADGQHLPEEIPRMTDAFWAFPERLWVGVRIMEPEKTPVSSRRGRSISNFWTSINGWQRCFDAQSGFRIYPIEETLALNCREDGFAFEMEVLVRASWSGLKIGHIDIDVFYPREGRVSHFDPKRDNLASSLSSFKLFWGMVVRAPLLTFRKIVIF